MDGLSAMTGYRTNANRKLTFKKGQRRNLDSQIAENGTWIESDREQTQKVRLTLDAVREAGGDRQAGCGQMDSEGAGQTRRS